MNNAAALRACTPAAQSTPIELMGLWLGEERFVGSGAILTTCIQVRMNDLHLGKNEPRASKCE
eukprot:365089-Chlamydomonas_euryale.AAC.1